MNFNRDFFKAHDKLLEAQRIAERTNFDVEMLRETGFCSGIENYSRHLTGAKPGEAPHILSVAGFVAALTIFSYRYSCRS